MKKFLRRIGLFAAMLTGLLALLTLAVPHNPVHYNYVHRLKMARLDTLPGPRLVIIGGSNCAFGLDCSILKDSTGLNPVNTASHASLGLKFMLDEAEPRLRRGDRVVIMPEYAQFYGSFNGANEALTASAIYGGLTGVRRFNAAQWLTFLGGIPKYILGNLKARKSGPGEYSALNFNEYGDETAHWQCAAAGVAPVEPPRERPIDLAAVSYLAEATGRFRARGCEVTVLPPITVRSNYEANRRRAAEIRRELRLRGVATAAPDTLFVFPDSLAYDTPYHVTRPAVVTASRRLASALR